MKIAVILTAIFVTALAVVWLHSALRDRSLRKQWETCLNQARSIGAGVHLKYPGCEGALNAVTTEPGLRVARSKDITHEDFADAIDRINPAAYPMTSLAQSEVKLKAIDRTWNVDSYPVPKGAVGRADNEPAPASGSSQSRDWSSNIRKMGNVGQAFSETYRVGWIAGQVPQIAGVANTESYAKAGAYEMLKQHMECAFLSMDQIAVYDQGPGLGAVGAGYRKLVDAGNAYSAASAYAIGKPTDIHSAPSGACLTGAMSSVHNRAMWKSVAFALRVAAKQKTDWMLIAGLSLRQAVTDLTVPTTTNLVPNGTGITGVSMAADQIRVLSRNETDSVLGASVDVIQTDFGRIMVTDVDYIGTTTTDSAGGALSAVNSASGTGAGARGLASFVANYKAGVLIKKGNLFKTWGIMPYSEKLGVDGSGDAYDAKCLAMLGVRNPILGGFLNFT
jgi:hypothetical protein